MELRRQGISNTEVLSAIERVPRERFVPETFKDQAYENIALPIDCGQTISQPQIVAYMTAALKLSPRLKVLEIGTGSGYQAAVLSYLCRRVYTIERHFSLAKEAEKRFAELRMTNIVPQTGDGSKGWPQQAPFDRIIVTAAPSTIPDVLIDQLAVDGRLVIPVGDVDQDLVLVTKTMKGVERKVISGVRFVLMTSPLT